MAGFDAKSLLEALIQGNTQPPAPSQTDLGNILNQVLKGAQGAPSANVQGAPGGGGLGDILGQVLGGGAGAQQPQGGAGAGGLGGLGDILGGMLGKAGSAGQSGASGLDAALRNILGQGQGGSAAPGGLPGNLGQAADIARNIFGKATAGVQDAARDINQSTGAGPQLDEIIKQISGGQGGGDLVAKAQEIIKQNPGLAGALAGVLGGLAVGTRPGRSLATGAAKLGGLVLIGGLAYSAYKNWRGGQATTASANAMPAPAPTGTGFEPQVQTNESATLYLKAMISAAATDGVIDQNEINRIKGGLQQAGHSADAAAFIEQEIQNPATPEQLAAACRSPEMAMQVYTAARVAIEPDSPSRKGVPDPAGGRARHGSGAGAAR